MMRLQTYGAPLLLLFVACSSEQGDDFFKQSSPGTTADGTGSIEAGVGGAGTTTTGGGGDAQSATSTSAPGTVTSGGAGDGSGTGGAGPTTVGTTTDVTATTSGGSGSGGDATGGSGAGGLGSGGDAFGGAGTGGANTGGSGTGGDTASTTGTAGGGTGGTDTCVPADERCDGLDNDCDEDVDEDDACPTGCFGDTFEGHAYMFCDRPPGQGGGTARTARTWQQAMQFCFGFDQVLVNIQTSAESDFVYGALGELDGSGDIWMGATDQDDEDVWSWALGMMTSSWEPFYDAQSELAIDDAFIDWRSGEPNDQGGEDCGVLEVQDGGSYLWDDRSCQTEFDRLVCEDPP